jgi:hypothetical protein
MSPDRISDDENRAWGQMIALVEKTMPELSRVQQQRIQRRLFSEWRRIWLISQDEAA